MELNPAQHSQIRSLIQQLKEKDDSYRKVQHLHLALLNFPSACYIWLSACICLYEAP